MSQIPIGTTSGGSPGWEAMLKVAEGYSQWKRQQKDAEQEWEEQMQAAFEALKVQAEAGELIVPAAVTPEETMAGERREVVEVVVLQHKQELLGGWESAGKVWDMQAETWTSGCGICRVRSGERVGHNWRRCPFHKRERKSATVAHGEVEAGVLSMVGSVRFEGDCPGCGREREACWMQVIHEPVEDGCRYVGVVTESAAVIMAVGPPMVEEWERREGRRRGAGVAGVESFTQQRFGALEVGRFWRTFGWVGVWDVREARVDQVCAQWEHELRTLVGEEATWPGSRHRVRQGQIGGRG